MAQGLVKHDQVTHEQTVIPMGKVTLGSQARRVIRCDIVFIYTSSLP